MTVGMLSIGSPPRGIISKRSTINVNFIDNTFDYQFIDHVKVAGLGVAPVDTYWTTGGTGNTVWNKAILDANGWPNSASANAHSFGNHVILPASTDYATYVFDWVGEGELTLNSGNVSPPSWTVTSSVGLSAQSSGDYTGINAKVYLTYSGPAQLVFWRVIQTNQTGNGYFRNFRFYRAADEADLIAGLIYRQAYKQQLVNLNPSAIRFMNWTGSNDAQACRFENRNLPNYASYGGCNPTISPAYGETSGANIMTLASAVGMPASMQHGEVVQCRIGAGLVRAGTVAGGKAVTAVTNANPGQVTAVGHGYTTGDVIVHTSFVGMTELSYRPVTIMVLDADNYTIGIDTTAFSSFAVTITKTGNSSNGSALITNLGNNTGLVSGSVQSVTGSTLPANEKVVSFTATQATLTTGTGVTAGTGVTFTFTRASGIATPYVSLNVGSRGAYPVIFTDGSSPGSINDNNYIATGNYKAFYFDKTLTASKDGSGADVYGVWMFSTSAPQSYLPYTPGTPLEICTALVNEVNDLALSQGVAGPTDMWVTIPHLALLSMDPDYSAVSNFAIGTASVVLNGANGYAGLVKRANLFLEYSNETWNPAFTQTSYLIRRGVLRDPVNGNGTSFMASLRSTIMTKDVRAALGTNRIKFVLSGQGVVGIANGSTNYNRAFGATAYNSDPLYDGSNPISHHDAWSFAGYFLAGSTFDGANLTAMATTWLADVGNATAQEADCAAYVGTVAGNTGVVNSGGSDTTRAYQTLRDSYITAFGSTPVIMYEGGWDKTVTGGTTNVNNFLIAVKRSQAWADAMAAFFDSFNAKATAFMPADYIQVDQRWGHTYQDTYSGHVEGAGLDKAFLAAGTRNRALIV